MNSNIYYNLITDVKFEPDYHTRIEISIENISIELPNKEVKTLLWDYTTAIAKNILPGIKHNDINTLQLEQQYTNAWSYSKTFPNTYINLADTYASDVTLYPQQTPIYKTTY